ncbi:MAG: hypothetical protein LT106_18635 [Burkholderiaceae bacterium]|nr:hypothetical protein [Burkholderiaceae bacterium]
MAMTLTEAAQLRDLQQQVDALTALVRALAAQVDELASRLEQSNGKRR